MLSCSGVIQLRSPTPSIAYVVLVQYGTIAVSVRWGYSSHLTNPVNQNHQWEADVCLGDAVLPEVRSHSYEEPTLLLLYYVM